MDFNIHLAPARYVIENHMKTKWSELNPEAAERSEERLAELNPYARHHWLWRARRHMRDLAKIRVGVMTDFVLVDTKTGRELDRV